MLRACHERIRQCKYFLSLWIILVFTNSVDPDKMSHYTAFHLGLHCLQKYVISIQRGLIL